MRAAVLVSLGVAVGVWGSHQVRRRVRALTPTSLVGSAARTLAGRTAAAAVGVRQLGEDIRDAADRREAELTAAMAAASGPAALAAAGGTAALAAAGGTAALAGAGGPAALAGAGGPAEDPREPSGPSSQNARQRSGPAGRIG